MKAKAKKAADTVPSCACCLYLLDPLLQRNDQSLSVQPAQIKTFLDKVFSASEDRLIVVFEAFTWKADKVSSCQCCCSAVAHACRQQH